MADPSTEELIHSAVAIGDEARRVASGMSDVGNAFDLVARLADVVAAMPAAGLADYNESIRRARRVATERRGG